jgi:hypothetical protein
LFRSPLLLLRLVLLLAVVACSVAPPALGNDPVRDKSDNDGPDAAAPARQDEADQRMMFMKSALAQYTIKVGDRKEPGKVGEPCFRLTNPLTNVKDGVIAVYSANGGRPDVIAKFFRQQSRTWVNEFAIIAPDDVTIMRSDRPFWKPSEYICKFTDVPDSPVPAAKPLLRLVQMRTIAEDFSVVDHFGAAQITDHNLRLLAKPVYRYSEEGKILDGCLFGFVLGTNLQNSLLLEAYKDEKGSRYRYAFAPMSIYAQDARYKDKPVWSMELRMIFGADCRKYYASVYFPASDETVPD